MDSKQIQNITESRLTYLDEKGEENFIDFMTCHKNFLIKQLSSETLKQVKELNCMNDEELLEYILKFREWREVGTRDMTIRTVMFHTLPQIQFKFETTESFYNFIGVLAKSDWKTFDLS